MRAARPDEYQNGLSAGSLVNARRCWLDLMDAGALPCPQQFTFLFQCPTARMAGGLTDFLRYADRGGFVRAEDAMELVGPPWRVAGTTSAAIRSLENLEHLFMDLRRAGARYESSLVRLDLLSQTGGEAPDPCGQEEAQ